MFKATLILFVLAIIAVVLTYINKKFKKIAMFFSFLSMLSLVLSIVEFASDYNPLTYIKEQLIARQKKNDASQNADSIEVHLPIRSDSTQDTDSTDEQQATAVTTVAFLNIDEQMYRNENGMIHIAWTPIADQTNYKLKIAIDDPFTSSEINYEYLCNTAQFDFDASAYSEDTTFFVSVAVFDNISSKWIYSETLSSIFK